jgi:fructose-1,6-bisphosphatase-3
MEPQHPQLHYLKLLSQQYPSIQAAATAMIDLTARLHLPKGTEHFLSDVHGEYEAFQHLLKNGAGSIRRKIDELFANTLTKQERRNLATLVYYPEQKLPLLLKKVDDKPEWYRLTLVRLITLCREVASKYQRTTVRAFLPDHMAAIIEELWHEQEHLKDKREYYRSLLDTIITADRADAFIIMLAELIQRLAISRLHVIGDIYDRGPGAHLILDALMEYHDVDIQWGNHDIVWMGAAAGSEACIANVIRICLRYANMETLENGYGISLLPLASFALDTYGNDLCERFRPKILGNEEFTDHELSLMAKMHKAMTIIQLKLEGQLIQRRPHYQMEDRVFLDYIDYKRGTIRVHEAEYPLLDTHFPTIDPAWPLVLNAEEQSVLDKLKLSFAISQKLRQHARFLFSKGSVYHIHDGNLLYHGCIAMNEAGTFKAFKVGGEAFSGKAFLDRVDRLARQGYFATEHPEQKQYGMDAMWYLWCGSQSPLFGKEKMATFERYFLDDKRLHEEKRNAYYRFRDEENTARKILTEFGLDPETGHIINGHVPVKVKKGERPVKANGKLMVIDGGFSKAYQEQTGIAGYTLISNSHGLLLAAHHSFESTQKAVEEEVDIDSETEVLHSHPIRMRVKDTDDGQVIERQIEDLRSLLDAYQSGLIKECSPFGL